jgi:hypothetical protein
MTPYARRDQLSYVINCKVGHTKEAGREEDRESSKQDDNRDKAAIGIVFLFISRLFSISH